MIGPAADGAVCPRFGSGVVGTPVAPDATTGVGTGAGPDPGTIPNLGRPGFSNSFFHPGDQASLKGLSHRVPAATGGHPADGREGPRGKKTIEHLVGKTLHGLGEEVLRLLLGVVPLRSKTTGGGKGPVLFPLPTSREQLHRAFPQLDTMDLTWVIAMCVSLNSIWGEDFYSEKEVTGGALGCLQMLVGDLLRWKGLVGQVERFDWQEFFNTRSIDYKGDEVKTARPFCWSNIAPALPQEIGAVPLVEVCTQGARYYVENFDLYIKRKEDWVLKKAPKVMVSDTSWAEVCQGLLNSGICTVLPRDEIFQTDQGPLLNGLFGVSKDEWDGEFEVFRLIMNLIPLNSIAHPLQGDVATLPMWSLMSPFFLQPEESLLISSEDVRCFFYTMAVPASWYKYLAFNKQVPQECLPEELQGQEAYLAARVLPMGFLNSVSLAQHVHRNLTLWSGRHAPGDGSPVNMPENEIRKDRPLTVGDPSWRVYLDNYDLLERVSATGMVAGEQGLAGSVLCLRQEYEKWEVPRNLKKAVSRSSFAEVQGAQVDGELGVAYPRESKLLKYTAACLLVLNQRCVTQKQLQVVCGGVVYFSMFRRQLLGGLNAIWTFIQGFAEGGPKARVLPDNCRLELARCVALLPLARMDFRLDFDEQVSCSDASSGGGGVCVSTSLSQLGRSVSQGKLRGQLPELRQDHQVLTIGLFDGIGALRVAADLLGVELIGHVSVERDKHASRVVESHFPDTVHVADVELVTAAMVREWALRFSQAAVVVIGAGPPCQGVSGLNSDRKGALRDERSCLFSHVDRI